MENSFSGIIQLAITPVILISGMGALMLTLTNRLGRVVDRTRSFAGQMAGGAEKLTPEEYANLNRQLEILWRRAILIRRAVTFAGLSMLASCLLVVTVFAAAVRGWDLELLALCLFAASVVLLIVALLMFLRDIFVSLHALHIEVNRARGLRSAQTAGD